MNKKNIAILFSIVFLQGLVFYIPISTLYRTNRGLSLSQIATIEAISFIVTMLCELPWGIIADKIGYKKVLIISNLLFFISKIVFYKANSLNIFLLERILLGITIAGLSGCDSSLLYKSCDEEHSSKIFSIYSFLGTLGVLIASLSYSLFMSNNDLLTSKWTAIVYFIAFVLTFFLDDYVYEKDKESKYKVKDLFKLLLKNAHYLLFVFSYILFNEAIREIEVFFLQLKYINIGIDVKLFGFISILLAVLELSSIFAARVEKKISIKKLVPFIYLAAIPTIIILALTNSKILVITFAGFLTIIGALLGPLTANHEQEQLDDAYRASMISFYSVLSSLFASGIDIGMGYVGDYNLSLAFFVACALCFISFILSVLYFKRQN